MKMQLVPLLKAILPLLLGAVGGIIATVYPAGFLALCAGGPFA